MGKRCTVSLSDYANIPDQSEGPNLFSRFRKMISIPIMEEESYEKNVVMYVCLGEPKHIAGEKETFFYFFIEIWVW